MRSILLFRATHRSIGRRARVSIIVALMFSAGACSSAASPARVATDGGNLYGGTAAGTADGVAAQPAAAASNAPATAGSPVDGSKSTAQDLVANETFIVKTGSMTVEVPAIDPALLRARTAIVGLGGYISGSDQANQGDQVLASVTYRIPAARWEEALDAIRALSTKVVTVKTGTSEVTGQVIDLGARIDNLKATEQALQAIMVKATRIQDILDVQNQLTDVRGQIEQLTTDQTHLKDQAALSTLTVLFQTPVVPAVKETSTGWDPATEFDRAASQLLGLGQGVATAGIWFGIVVLPLLVVLVFLLAVLAFVLRRISWRPSRPSGPPAAGDPPTLGNPPAVDGPPAIVGGGTEA